MVAARPAGTSCGYRRGKPALSQSLCSLFSSQQNKELFFYGRHEADLRAEGGNCNRASHHVRRQKKNKSKSLKSEAFLLLDAAHIEIRGESTIGNRLNADIVILDFILTNSLLTVIKSRPYAESAMSVGRENFFN